VNWEDKHESIFPFVNLRLSCPCLDCERIQASKRTPAEPEQKLQSVQALQDASVILRWSDGHETIFLVEELRALCGCASCRGEPNYPITGQ
jgi:DUF971 family protein